MYHFIFYEIHVSGLVQVLREVQDEPEVISKIGPSRSEMYVYFSEMVFARDLPKRVRGTEVLTISDATRSW